MKDLSRRKAVMSRSIKLGHCVCNPKQPCPCPTFKQFSVCQCAGEKLPKRAGAAALTKQVRKAGCASKIGQADLLRVLEKLPVVDDPNVLVGTAAGDDAGVYRLTDDCALVQTVDVFTPCVDDPYLFGQIAAANSVSDVYAMGGRPICALSIVGFPIDELDDGILAEMLRGGTEKLREAGCALVGGHSINDAEIKLGFAVTGLIDPSTTVQRDHARPGDALVLTKPIGTGMVAFAAQIGRVSEACIEEVGAFMATLNRDAAELMQELGAHACTDITGFGLAGHLVGMMRGSGVSIELDLSQLPVFAAVAGCIESDILSGAIERNQAYAMAWVEPEATDRERDLSVLYDPQTSGGLLISLPPDRAQTFVDRMRERGHPATSIIGRVLTEACGSGRNVCRVVNIELSNWVGQEGGVVMGSETRPVERPDKPEEAGQPEVSAESCCAASAPEPCCEQPPSKPCCERPPDADTTEAGQPLDLFKSFMTAANRPGLIDRRAKRLMAIALSVSQRCRPCLLTHAKAALNAGISKAEIDEAATLAISFGGCTALIFYQEVCEELGI